MYIILFIKEKPNTGRMNYIYKYDYFIVSMYLIEQSFCCDYVYNKYTK